MRKSSMIVLTCAALIASGSLFAGSGSWSLKRPPADKTATADTTQEAVKGATGPEGTAGPASKPAQQRTPSPHR